MSNPWVKTAIRAGVLALIGTTAWSAIPVVWHTLGETDHNPTLQTPKQASAAPEAPDVDAILALAPFGSPVRAVPANSDTAAAALNLKLNGILMGPDQTSSSAVIHDGQKSSLVSVEDQISDTISVDAIYPDHVVLDVSGKTVKLGFDAQETVLVVAKGGNETNDEPAPKQVQTAAHRALSAKPPQPETPQEYIDYWRDRIRKNPGDVAKAIGLVRTDEGYRIAQNHDTGVQLAGFKPGDLVTRVNGNKVGNYAKDRKLYDEIAAEGIAQVEFLRNGKLIKLSFPLR